MTRRSEGSRKLALALMATSALALGSTGCASAPPVLAGGTTTPSGRSDLAVGAAHRFPLGALASSETRAAFQSDAVEAGPVPVMRYRYGFSRDFDGGVTVFGPAMSVDGRYTLWVDDDNSVRPAITVGASGHGGLFDGGGRYGARLTSLFTMSATSLVELWLGPMLGFQGVSTGDAHGSVAAHGFLAGGVVGLATGFRNFHVLMELIVSHELWGGESNQGDLSVSGVSLTPAFACRWRL